jgi:uncharacterized protein (DUF2267 family)
MQALMPARLDGQVISFAAFVAAVQDMGALATVGEADRAARGALGDLGGCLSWGAAENLASHLPRPLRQVVRDRRFDSSMSRFAPQAFLRGMAEDVGTLRAARDARAVLRTLDLILPEFLREQLRAELASLWRPLTMAEDGQPSRVLASAAQPASTRPTACVPLAGTPVLRHRWPRCITWTTQLSTPYRPTLLIGRSSEPPRGEHSSRAREPYG